MSLRMLLLFLLVFGLIPINIFAAISPKISVSLNEEQKSQIINCVAKVSLSPNQFKYLALYLGLGDNEPISIQEIVNRENKNYKEISDALESAIALITARGVPIYQIREDILYSTFNRKDELGNFLVDPVTRESVKLYVEKLKKNIDKVISESQKIDENTYEWQLGESPWLLSFKIFGNQIVLDEVHYNIEKSEEKKYQPLSPPGEKSIIPLLYDNNHMARIIAAYFEVLNLAPVEKEIASRYYGLRIDEGNISINPQLAESIAEISKDRGNPLSTITTTINNIRLKVFYLFNKEIYKISEEKRQIITDYWNSGLFSEKEKKILSAGYGFDLLSGAAIEYFNFGDRNTKDIARISGSSVKDIPRTLRMSFFKIEDPELFLVEALDASDVLEGWAFLSSKQRKYASLYYGLSEDGIPDPEIILLTQTEIARRLAVSKPDVSRELGAIKSRIDLGRKLKEGIQNKLDYLQKHEKDLEEGGILTDKEILALYEYLKLVDGLQISLADAGRNLGYSPGSMVRIINGRKSMKGALEKLEEYMKINL